MDQPNKCIKIDIICLFLILFFVHSFLWPLLCICGFDTHILAMHEIYCPFLFNTQIFIGLFLRQYKVNTIYFFLFSVVCRGLPINKLFEHFFSFFFLSFYRPYLILIQLYFHFCTEIQTKRIHLNFIWYCFLFCFFFLFLLNVLQTQMIVIINNCMWDVRVYVCKNNKLPGRRANEFCTFILHSTLSNKENTFVFQLSFFSVFKFLHIYVFAYSVCIFLYSLLIHFYFYNARLFQLYLVFIYYYCY